MKFNINKCYDEDIQNIKLEKKEIKTKKLIKKRRDKIVNN